MEEVASRPFAVDPQMLMSIVKGLYSLNPGKFSFSGLVLSRVGRDFMEQKENKGEKNFNLPCHPRGNSFWHNFSWREYTQTQLTSMPSMLLFFASADYVVCLVLPEFSRHNPELFARFIPNLLPPTHWDQLPTLIQEDRMLQENLVTSQGFSR